MGQTFENFLITSNNELFLIYDFERNSIISYSKEINVDKIINILSNNRERAIEVELTNEERSLFDYLQNNIIHAPQMEFDTYNYFKKQGFKITSASLMIAQNCNLRCTYCYGGESGHYNSETPLMSEEIAKKAIDRLVKDNKKDNIITINFFGGEPLVNFKLIKFVVNECHTTYSQYSFVFTITTNATLINKQIATFFKENNFRVLVSIDGPQYVHNFHRKFRNGKGSFDRVIKSIKLLKEVGLEFRIRSTLDHRFYDQYNEIVEFLKSIESDRIIVSKLINYSDEEISFPIDVSEMKHEETFLQVYLQEAISDVLEGKYPKNFPYLSYFKKIAFAEKSLMNCGAYEAGTAIASDGKFYPCHRFVGMKGFDFGDVENGIDKNKLKKQSDSLDATNNEECLKCFGKYICQRACLRDIAKSGGVYIPRDKEYCNLLRKTVEDALIVYYLILTKRPDFFNTMIINEKEE